MTVELTQAEAKAIFQWTCGRRPPDFAAYRSGRDKLRAAAEDSK